MEWIVQWLCLFMLLGVLYSHPAPVSSLQYELGISYKYNYQFTILLNEDSNITSRSASVGRNVGYLVSTDFMLTNIWQNEADANEKLLKLELLKPKLHVSSHLHNMEESAKHWSKLDNLSYPPIYINWNNGFVKTVCLLPDVQSMIDIKKGLASLFQIHVSQTETEELDASGFCQVRYKVDGKYVKKVKRNCRQKSKLMEYGINKLRSSTTSVSSELLYTLRPEGIIQTVVGTEEVMSRLNMWTQAAVFVKSKLKLEFLEQYGNQQVIHAASMPLALRYISDEIGLPLKEEDLEVQPKANDCKNNCQPLRVFIHEFTDYLLPQNIARIKSASGFLKLLDAFRRATKKEIILAFKEAKKEILTQLLDILAAVQTSDSLDVAFELIDFDSEDSTIPERFLLCLAVSPYPNEMVLIKTLKVALRKFRTEKVRATALIALSSLLRTYCDNNPKKANTKLIDDITNVILNGQRCSDATCILVQLYAMRNAAQPVFVPFLIQYAPAGGTIGFAAIKALASIDTKHYTPEVHRILLKIYNQYWPHQDSTARVLAAKLLIKSKPTTDVISTIVMSLSDRENFEITALVLATLQQAALEDSIVNSNFRKVLSNMHFGNYNNLAQNGSSTTYSKILFAAHDVNMTYGIDLEMRKTGVLKGTGMTLQLGNQQEKLPLLSLEMFVNGIGLMDEEIKEMEVPEERSAGMELSVLGVKLRPYVFFTGTSELMSLVWSGVGSEPTSALQANFLITDERKLVVLQNGITVDFTLRGALSTDVSGTVEISMWNKNAHGAVKNSGALLIQGFCHVDTAFVESQVHFALGGHSSMNMMVNLDFAEKPMQMCLQLEQPDFTFKHNVRKIETIPGSKQRIKTLKRRTIFLPGKSFALHQKLYNSCQELLNPKPKSYW